MKNLGLILVMLLSINMLSAQQQRGGQRMSIEERQKKELKTLRSTLGLDKAQEAKVVTLQAAFAKDFNTLRSGMSQNSDRSAMRKKMNTLRTQYDKDIEALLTEEQKVKYKEMLEKRKNQSGQRSGQNKREKQGKGKKKQS